MHIRFFIPPLRLPMGKKSGTSACRSSRGSIIAKSQCVVNLVSMEQKVLCRIVNLDPPVMGGYSPIPRYVRTSEDQVCFAETWCGFMFLKWIPRSCLSYPLSSFPPPAFYSQASGMCLICLSSAFDSLHLGGISLTLGNSPASFSLFSGGSGPYFKIHPRDLPQSKIPLIQDSST